MTRPRDDHATATTVETQLTDGWFTVCDARRLIPGRGVAALLPDGRQAALFLDRAGRMYAIDNRDPFSGADVLSRGLTGTRRRPPVRGLAAAQAALRPGVGRCLDDESVTVATYAVRTAGPGPPHAARGCEETGGPAPRRCSGPQPCPRPPPGPST